MGGPFLKMTLYNVTGPQKLRAPAQIFRLAGRDRDLIRAFAGSPRSAEARRLARSNPLASKIRNVAPGIMSLVDRRLVQAEMTPS
jgi:hypothetical protein